MEQNLQIVGGDIEPGDLVLYRANYNAGLFTVTRRCMGFWGKPNGKLHISGFSAVHSGGGYRHEDDVYPVELVKVKPAEETE